jgi:hypothetical protein
MTPDPGREHMMGPRVPHPEAGTAVHLRAKFATFEYDGRGVVEHVPLTGYPGSPLIAVRIEHPKGRKRRVYPAMSDIVGPWEGT